MSNQASKIPGTSGVVLRATSHTSLKLWPRNCESPKESVQRLSQDTSKNMCSVAMDPQL